MEAILVSLKLMNFVLVLQEIISRLLHNSCAMFTGRRLPDSKVQLFERDSSFSIPPAEIGE
jgi:hypothetical protein